MKRTISLLLAALLLTGALASCSENSPAEGETAPAADAVPSAEAEAAGEDTPREDRTGVPDNLPDVSFDGRDFRVLTTDGYASYGFDYSTEIAAEELNGDACNDAVFNRNLTVEGRFDTAISCAMDSNPSTYINTLVKSGEDAYEIVGMYDFLIYNAINAHSVMNWTEVPHIDPAQPWYVRRANEGSTINGILYGIVSDLSITSMLYTHAFFFNQRLLEDHGTSANDMYDLVKEGKWTLDQAMALTNGLYVDTNGNGRRDEDDTYGFAYSVWNAADVWLSAFDQSVCRPSADGIEITFMSDKTVSIVEKLCSWHYDSGCFYNYPNIYGEETHLKEGNLVFAPIRFKACFDSLRDMEDPYGIIPYPKWDENQADYLTNADDKFTVFTIPLTASGSLDFIGVLYEALSAESWKTVYPAYYDTALKGKYSTDATTAEMVDLVMAGRNFDFSFQFGESYFQQLPYWVRQAIQSNDTDISSRYAKIQKSLNKGLSGKLYPLYGLGD